MDRLTRKELKTDRFAMEVQHSVEYMAGPRRQVIRWGSAGGAIVVIALAVYVYRQHMHSVRQEALFAAMQIQNATIGQAPNEYVVAFPSQADREKAAVQAFTDLATKYPGTEEGSIAQYFLGTNASDQGKMAEAEKRFKDVADSGDPNIASLAKLSLAQIYGSEGKTAEGEKLLRSLIVHPSALVSKEQATFALAQLLKNTNPQEARKLVEPLRSSSRPPISRQAITVLSEIPQK